MQNRHARAYFPTSAMRLTKFSRHHNMAARPALGALSRSMRTFSTFTVTSKGAHSFLPGLHHIRRVHSASLDEGKGTPARMAPDAAKKSGKFYKLFRLPMRRLDDIKLVYGDSWRSKLTPRETELAHYQAEEEEHKREEFKREYSWKRGEYGWQAAYKAFQESEAAQRKEALRKTIEHRREQLVERLKGEHGSSWETALRDHDMKNLDSKAKHEKELKWLEPGLSDVEKSRRRLALTEARIKLCLKYQASWGSKTLNTDLVRDELEEVYQQELKKLPSGS